eukprot:CAMPEP_0119299548 /NCGR_PEP_ID=MMETSP1333-20130426/1626_1 /TAXON_ID=418940 /ORGANISM="Scyphosphaera apsteinii, Strain RCC1455" /LENGTH=119 /DNA_ID=CAMNT_0007301011 /DNA_START=325 /DNA_END=683 /DNA_ORIENTATION=+
MSGTHILSEDVASSSAVIDLLAGAQCAGAKVEDSRQTVDSGAASGSGGNKGFFNMFSGSGPAQTNPVPNASEPTFTVNVNPSQVAAGATMVANAANAAASAATPPPANNPFFGNAHIKQ